MKKNMKTLKSFFLIVVIIIISKTSLFAWTSSNEGVCYTMDTLCYLSDSISFNTSDNLYEVDCDIIILSNDTLKFLPGDTVKFISYLTPPNIIMFTLTVYGCLLAIGTADEPIFLGDPESDWGVGHGWCGIQIINTSKYGESVLKYCFIRKAKYYYSLYQESSIYLENSSPILDHCVISLIGSGEGTGGCCAIGLRGQSYPIVSFCTFKQIKTGVAIWCNPYDDQDTINYPSPLMYNCNIMKSVQGFCWLPSFYDHVIINGGFLDNCYLGIPFSNTADTSLGNPVDTIGDGICKTVSTCPTTPRYYMVDGVVNPRSDTLITGINETEIEILPTTTDHLILKNCFPNPFHDFTTIEFDLSEPSQKVSLIVLDSKGNRVKTLLNEEILSPGELQVKWHGDNDSGIKVKEGIYFYKLTCNNKMMVKKAIVIK
jgi:hypothetical protein